MVAGARDHRGHSESPGQVFSLRFPSTPSRAVGLAMGKAWWEGSEALCWLPGILRCGVGAITGGEVRAAGKPCLHPHPSCSHAPLGHMPGSPREKGQVRAEWGGSGPGGGPWGTGTGCSLPPTSDPESLVTIHTGAEGGRGV